MHRFTRVGGTPADNSLNYLRMAILPFHRFPGMNTLFLDFVENAHKVSEFYPSRGQSARPPAIPHRAELADILARQNNACGNPATGRLIEKFREADTYCVITGQQVGLLTGPMYTLWKALTAIRLSSEMEKEGKRCVPVFWMATEDHNLHEIMSFGLLKDDQELVEFSLKDHLFLKRQPTGTIPASVPEVRSVLLRCQREIRTVPEIRQFYPQESTLGQGFARTLLWLLRDFPILIVDPSDPALKRLAAPFFERFLQRRGPILEMLERQNERLRSRNYPVQVRLDKGQLPLFHIDGQERKHWPADPDQASGIPVEQVSPAALLRPLFQDFLFPTLAYVGGPAEIAYFAQLHPWYAAMEIEQPWLVPRASITLLPPATARFLQSRNVRPEELFLPEDTVMDALVSNRELEEIRAGLKELEEATEKKFAALQGPAGKLEPQLRNATRTAQRKVQYQIRKLERKSLFSARRRNSDLSSQIRHARNVVFPDGKPQERYLNIFSFASRLPDLVAQVYEKFQWNGNGHQWISI